MRCFRTVTRKWAVFFVLVIPTVLPAALYFSGFLHVPVTQPVLISRDGGTKHTTPHLTLHRASGNANPNVSSVAANGTSENLAGNHGNASSNASQVAFENRTSHKNNGSSTEHPFSTESVVTNSSSNETERSPHDGKNVTEDIGTERRGMKEERDLSGYVLISNQTQHMELSCSQCAYVSSSGQMRGTNAGHLIDSFPCVIRMNNAPTIGYEKDVGSRTTARVVAHSAIRGVNNERKKLLTGRGQPKFLLVWGPASQMTTARKTSTFNIAAGLSKEMAEISDMQVVIISQKQYDRADEVFENETGKSRFKSGTWLTTGWFTMLFARAACDEVHVFGMVNEDHCLNEPDSKVPYHYYQPEGKFLECSLYKRSEAPKMKGHHFMTEKSIFARWSKLESKIFFKHPDWSA